MRLKRPALDPEIPTSSMADIAFLLIVFFMLTTVFSANRGITHVLPERWDTELNFTPTEAVFIKVYPSGDFEMDRALYRQDQRDEVYKYMMAKLDINPNKPVILHTDRKANYGHMIAILDVLKRVERDMDAQNPDRSYRLALTFPNKEERRIYASMNL